MSRAFCYLNCINSTSVAIESTLEQLNLTQLAELPNVPGNLKDDILSCYYKCKDKPDVVNCVVTCMNKPSQNFDLQLDAPSLETIESVSETAERLKKCYKQCRWTWQLLNCMAKCMNRGKNSTQIQNTDPIAQAFLNLFKCFDKCIKTEPFDVYECLVGCKYDSPFPKNIAKDQPDTFLSQCVNKCKGNATAGDGENSFTCYFSCGFLLVNAAVQSGFNASQTLTECDKRCNTKDGQEYINCLSECIEAQDEASTDVELRNSGKFHISNVAKCGFQCFLFNELPGAFDCFTDCYDKLSPSTTAPPAHTSASTTTKTTSGSARIVTSSPPSKTSVPASTAAYLARDSAHPHTDPPTAMTDPDYNESDEFFKRNSSNDESPFK